MTAYAFDPPARAAAPIEGEAGLFPIRRIFCVGRNYAAHAREMGADEREPPFFFCKPADAYVASGAEIAYPRATLELHHEIEVVAALESGGSDIPVDRALACVLGYAVGVDLTRRDLQNAAKAKGHPWDSGKAFDDSAPMSAIKRWSGPPPTGDIRLSVNGQARQHSTVSLMIWSMAEVIAEASKLWRLQAGDLIFSGTPAGVGPIARGDLVEGAVDGVGAISFRIV